MALELAKKVAPPAAGVILVLIIAGAILVELAGIPGPGVWIFACLCIVVLAVLFALHMIDRPRRVGLDDADRQAVRDALRRAREDVAQRLKCDVSRCRANLFQETPLHRLQIIDGLWVGMDERNQEWDISMPKGRGATGKAWRSKEPQVIIWPFTGEEDLDPADAQRVDPALRWIISVPVVVERNVKWVVNVDGKDERERSAVEAAVGDVTASLPSLKAAAAHA